MLSTSSGPGDGRQQALHMQLLDFADEQTTSLCMSSTDVFSFKRLDQQLGKSEGTELTDRAAHCA